MRTITTIAVTAAVTAGVLLYADRAAPAGPVATGAAAIGSAASVQADTFYLDIQRGPRGPRGGPGPRDRGRRGGGGVGGAAAIGIAGGIITGIIAAEQARAADERDALIAQCARRYRSYDPQTQTYVGRGGRIYTCP